VLGSAFLGAQSVVFAPGEDVVMIHVVEGNGDSVEGSNTGFGEAIVLDDVSAVGSAFLSAQSVVFAPGEDVLMIHMVEGNGDRS